MSTPLSLTELLSLPKQEAESYILQLSAPELASLRSDLEAFIRNASASILEQVSQNALQNEGRLSGPPSSNPLGIPDASSSGNMISVSESDASLVDAKQMLLESQTCITENLCKLRVAVQEEHILGQIEDLINSTLNLSDQFGETCSQEAVDSDTMVGILSESLRIRTALSHIEPPFCCTEIFSRLKDSVDTLYTSILSHIEAAYLSNLVCLESPQSRAMYEILLDYNEAYVVVCRNFTMPLLQKLSCHSPLKILENISVLISRLNTENRMSWLEFFRKKPGIESESATYIYSNAFHQCLTIPLINFLATQSNPSIVMLSYFQTLQYLRCMHKIYSNASVDPWPGLKDALLLEKKIEDNINNAFEAIVLPLRGLNARQGAANTIVSEFPDRLCQTLNLFLRPPAEVLSENPEIPCGYFIPALADKVLINLSSALQRLATQLLVCNKERFYKSLIEKLTTVLVSYSRNISMAQGFLEFLNALPTVRGPESVPQIQDLYFSTLKEYLGIFINWLCADPSLH